MNAMETSPKTFSPASLIRDERGRLLPGHLPLPGGGRPKGSLSRARLQREAARMMDAAMRDTLVREQARLRGLILACAESIFNRIKKGDTKALRQAWEFMNFPPHKPTERP